MSRTEYDARVHVPWVASLAKRGCTQTEIAEAMGIARRTVTNWANAHPEFGEAMRASKSEADELVVDSLYNRATGRCRRMVKKVREVLTPQGTVMQLEETTIEQLPPDTTAMIYWLKNRQPERWRDRPAMVEEKDGADEFLKAWTDDSPKS